MMTTTPWLRWTVSLITTALLVSCGGGTHELGTSPDAGAASGAGSTGATADAGGGGVGGSTVDAPLGGAGGIVASGGVTSTGDGAGQGGKSTASAGSLAGAGAGGSSSSSMLCCNMLACPGGYTLIGVVSGEARSTAGVTCPAGAKCQTFTTSCGCNTVLCAEGALDAGVDTAGGQGGNAGSGGSGGAGGKSGGSCPVAPPCNWCDGTPIKNADGCVTDWRCANGVSPCSTYACTESNPCAPGFTCRDMLCWPGDAGAGGTGGSGAGGTGGTGGSSGSGTCPLPTSCNWCGGEMLKDSNGCFVGYRCANGADPCKTSSCSASAPCPSGQTCRDMLCWPNDGGAGGDGGTTAPGCGYQCQTVGGVTGWYLNNQLVCEADCQDCTVSCENVGTRSEGCWSTCGGSLSAGCASSGREGLINYSFCSDPYAAGYFVLHSPDPATGIGPAVVVSAAGGWMRAWAAIGTFEPENVPSNPSTTMEFDRARLNDLFSRLAAVDLTSLPHAPVTGPEKCRPTLYYRLCAGCTAKTLTYPALESVSPEMDEVWAWFESIVYGGPGLVVNPHRFCESGG